MTKMRQQVLGHRKHKQKRKTRKNERGQNERPSVWHGPRPAGDTHQQTPGRTCTPRAQGRARTDDNFRTARLRRACVQSHANGRHTCGNVVASVLRESTDQTHDDTDTHTARVSTGVLTREPHAAGRHDVVQGREEGLWLHERRAAFPVSLQPRGVRGRVCTRQRCWNTACADTRGGSKSAERTGTCHAWLVCPVCPCHPPPRTGKRAGSGSGREGLRRASGHHVTLALVNPGRDLCTHVFVHVPACGPKSGPRAYGRAEGNPCRWHAGHPPWPLGPCPPWWPSRAGTGRKRARSWR